MTDVIQRPAVRSIEAAQTSYLAELFERQQKNRAAVAARSAAERRDRLVGFKAAILAHREALIQAFAADFGRPSVEVEALDIQPVLGEIDHTVAHLQQWMKPHKVRTPLLLFRGQGEVWREPRGVVLIMAPWNYPALLLLAPLVSAVAAGNCVICKPSEKVPHVAEVLGKIIADAFPADEVALVTGAGDVGEALLALPFDHFFFTGGAEVGRKVMHAAANHLSSVTLELGGKSPAIVDSSVNIRTAAERIVWGKTINAGQTCVATDYVLVHESRAPALVTALAQTMRAFYGATPAARLSSRDLTRIIDDGAFKRLSALLDQAVQAGARLAFGGERDPQRRIMTPALLVDVDLDNPIMQNEIFGPLLPVLTYRTVEEALAIVRAHDQPLALYVFSDDKHFVDHILRSTRAGGTVVNNTVLHLGNAELPFGGVGTSGTGNYHGEFGFRTFSHERAVQRQLQPSLLPFFFPPYTRRTRATVQLATFALYRLLPGLFQRKR